MYASAILRAPFRLRSLAAVGGIRPSLEVAEDFKLLRRRRRRFLHRPGKFYRPAAGFLHLFAGDARVNRDDGEFLRLRVRPPDREIGNEQRRTLGPDAEFLAVITASAVSKSSASVPEYSDDRRRSCSS